MTILYAALALGAIAACGVFIATWSLTPVPPSNADLVEGRLRAYETGLPVSLVEMELQAPFGERVLRPALQRLGHLLEPVQEDPLLVLLAETGNSSVEETHPVEAEAPDEGPGGSLESNEEVVEPSTPATEDVEESGERDEAVAGSVDGQGMDQHERATPAYRCSVYGCSGWLLS